MGDSSHCDSIVVRTGTSPSRRSVAGTVQAVQKWHGTGMGLSFLGQMKRLPLNGFVPIHFSSDFLLTDMTSIGMARRWLWAR